MSEYTREFHHLRSCNNLQESEEQLVTRFVGGLKDKLKNKLAMHPQYSLTNAINVAERLERQSSCYSTSATDSTSHREQATYSINSCLNTDCRCAEHNPLVFQTVILNCSFFIKKLMRENAKKCVTL